MLNPSPVLNQLTWGVHLNFGGHFTSPFICPDWSMPLPQQVWHRQGVVVWEANVRIVATLYARHALEILEHMRVNNTQKENGLIIGSSSFQLLISRIIERSIMITDRYFHDARATPRRFEDHFGRPAEGYSSAVR